MEGASSSSDGVPLLLHGTTSDSIAAGAGAADEDAKAAVLDGTAAGSGSAGGRSARLTGDYAHEHSAPAADDKDEDGVGPAAPRRWSRAWLAAGARSLVTKPRGADLATVTVAAYGMTGVVVAFLSDVPAIFLTPFLLQVPKMNALAAGNMLLIAKVFDAITDPIIGTASDATRNRFGRRRPWMLASLPISVAFNILLFQHWSALDGNAPAIFAYYLVCLCLSTFGMTCFWIPAAALPVTISSKDVDRVRLVSTRAINVFLSTIVGVLIMGLFVSTFTSAERGTGYLIAAAINSACIAIAGLLSVFGIPEPSSLKLPHLSVHQELQRFVRGMWDLLRSWPYVCVTIIATLGWLGTAFVQSNFLLFIHYAVGLQRLFIAILFVALASCAIFVPLTYWLLRRISKRWMMTLGCVWLIGTWMGHIFVPTASTAAMFTIAFISGGGLAITTVMPWVMLTDVIDLDELTNGKRREGLLSAVFVSINKITNGLALAFSGIILNAGGYDNSGGGTPAPSDELNRTMRLLVGVIPVCCAALMLPFLYFHPLTATVQKRVNAELVAKRKQLLAAADSDRAQMIVHDDSSSVSM